MRRILLIPGLLATSLVASLVAALPAQAAPTGESATNASRSQAAQPNFDLPHKVGEYYIPLKLTPVDGDVSPAAYPSGCGLTVILLRSGNNLTGSMTTSCNSVVNSIDHTMYFYRSRFYGWERMATNDPPYSYNVYSKGDSIYYNCAGTGTHDFRVESFGYVNKGGTTYNASAYDQIDNVTCT